MNFKNFIFNNLGLKLTALFLAAFLWAMISGKERSYSEKTWEVNVEYSGVAANIHIRSVNPDKVRVKVKGTSKELTKIKPEDFKLRVDLTRITESTRLNVFTEDVLAYPEGMEIMSIHPKMIEITAEQLITRDVGVRVRYKGKMKPGVKLLGRRIVPEKVKIYGYKSQILSINEVEAEQIVNLPEIEETRVIKIPLKKVKEILRFEDADSVDVHVTVENRNKNKNGKSPEE